MWTRSLIVGAAAALLVATSGCGVKPPLKYVSPDGTLHDVLVQGGGLRPQRPETPDQRADESVRDEGAPPAGSPADGFAERPPADEVQAHFTTAVGLQAECRHEEALAFFRGVVEADPDGPLAPRAMVRMAEIYLAQGYAGRDELRGRELLAEVVGRFPGSAAATAACDRMPELCLPTG